jgi:gliding motility-associated-like protein
MKKATLLSFVLFFVTGLYAQYATLGSGKLKNQIWWFDWNGFTITNGASKNFTTADGLFVTITFSNVTGATSVPVPSVMNTWSGAVLHLLYNFSDPAIKPALYSSTSTVGQNTEFTISVTATRNGVAVPFTFIAADAEASTGFEITTLTTNGGKWNSIDFFKNSAQTINPLTGCNTNTVVIANTYGGTAATGQNPVLSTRSLANGQLQINTLLTRQGVAGGMGLAFGIFAPIDRGDLPASYGFVQHELTYTAVNSCNYQPPFPSLVQNDNLRIGNVAGDADGSQATDDNAIGADEDALTSMPLYDRTGSYTIMLPVHNTTGVNVYLSGWFDMNRNGSFEAGEFVAAVVPDQATTTALTWTGVPVALTAGDTYAFRFRISSDQVASQNSTGFAKDGEVEDYFSIVNAVVPPPVVTAGFNVPDTVCVNAPVHITNTSVNGSNYYWNFCVADAGTQVPEGNNLGNPGGYFQKPVFTDIAFENGNYYVFSVNNYPGRLVRLDFGNSLLNTPVAHDLGTVGGIVTNYAEGIQVVKNKGKWYALIVEGSIQYGVPSRIVKIDFGTDPANNAPTGTNWGNIGNMDYAIDLHIFQEGANWYGFTLNSENKTITRLSFGDSFDNTPTGINLGNMGGFIYPTGIFAIQHNGNWHAFVTDGSNDTNASIFRLDFGNSLLNMPTAVKLGDPGNVLHQPRDITILKSCGQITGMVVNGSSNYNNIVKLDFKNDLSSIPAMTSLGNIGSLSFPHSISKLFRVEADLYTFVTNVNNNTITRIKFSGCTNASTPNSALQNPPDITYKAPGSYNINLTVDDGLSTQSTFCKSVVVQPKPVPDFSFEQQICNPLSVKFRNETTGAFSFSWDFGDGTLAGNLATPQQVYATYQNYSVKLVAKNSACADSTIKNLTVGLTRDSIVTTHDTASCDGKAVVLKTVPEIEYCWSPAGTLSAANASNPLATPVTPTTYRVYAKVLGQNLVNNGDFSQGNTGFSSAYSYTANNTTEGEYFVGSNPAAWNPSTQRCIDHTNGTGNMLLVNGSPVADVKVWCQNITVTPHTNYVFSAWLQAIHPANPAKLQFYINGRVVADIFSADPTPCTWKQFYMTWNSGQESAINICIVNKNTIIAGNDFALDDVFFGSVTMRYDSVYVGMATSPVLPVLPDASICVGDTIRPASSGALHYNWTPAQYVSGIAAATPLIYPVQSATYTVSAYNTLATCLAQKSFYAKVSPAPRFAISPATVGICEGASVSITASGADHYTWMANNVMAPSLTGAQIDVSPKSSIVYKVAVKDDLCGRMDTLQSIVQVDPVPVTAVTKSGDIDCMTGGAQLNATGGNVYRWSPATGLSNPDVRNPAVLTHQTTKYYVTVSKGNCAVTDSIIVLVNLNSEKNLYLVPTAFTPNGDGKNDCFGLKYWGKLSDLNFAVYNRWGQQLFFTKDITNCWNGTFKGEPQPLGAYVYVISGTALCGPVLRKGMIILMR